MTKRDDLLAIADQIAASQTVVSPATLSMWRYEWEAKLRTLANSMTVPEDVKLNIKFLLDAAQYFERRDTGGEDSAHWANIKNAENCREIAATLEALAAENARLREIVEAAKRVNDAYAAERFDLREGQYALVRLHAALQGDVK